MPSERSYLDKTFLVADSQARIRKDSLLDFVTWNAGEAMPPGVRAGDIKCIPRGTRVKVQDVRTIGIGSNVDAFALTFSEAGARIGWTATTNFEGVFANETIGLLPPAPVPDQKGPNALWEGGVFLRQEPLVQIGDHDGKIKRLTQPMVGPYFAMVEAARLAGVPITLRSGFRSFPEQVVLFDLSHHGGAQAATPGTSPHQNGIALDIAEAAAGPGNATYDWMARNAMDFGFLRTVDGEAWHWELRPAAAATAKARGTCKIRPMSP